jgi:hypothetical protein
MKNTTDIDTAIESLSASAKGLRDFYEELYGESVDDFNFSEETASTIAATRKSGLLMKISILQNMVESLQSQQK